MFRILDEQVVVLILNKNEEPFELDLNRFKEMTLEDKELTNIFTDKKVVWKNRLKLDEKGAMILTTNK